MKSKCDFYNCAICNQEIISFSFGAHLRKHKISHKEYAKNSWRNCDEIS
jgi:hypothetical protein